MVDGPADRPYRISMEVEKAASQLEVLGNVVRLEIYRMLVRAGDPGLSCGAIQQRVGIPASTLTHHIHRLMAADLLRQERQGTTLICRAHYPAMHGLVDFLSAECCADERGRPGSITTSSPRGSCNEQ
jgi:ArsR family transcriptional regulator, arsenate/arsenite/antimonite-responsive transcriptional repressor